MNRPASTIIAAAAMLAAIPAALRAEDLTTEITVDRTVVPVEQAAGAPRSFHPVLRRPATAAYRMPLTDYARTATLGADSLPALPPAEYPGLQFPDASRGYASLGYFPALCFGAEAGYRIVDSRSTRIDAWGSYQGHSYTTSRVPATEPDKAGRIAANALQLAAAASQAVGSRSTLGLALTYRHDALRLPSALDPEASQAINAFSGQLDWATRWSKASVEASLRAATTALHTPLAVPLALSPTGLADGAAEADYSLRVDARLDGSRGIGGALVLDADILHRRRGLEWTPDLDAATDAGGTTPCIFGISPRVLFSRASLHGHIGLRLDIAGGYDGAAVRVAPDINIAWTPNARFAIFMRATGGSSHNSLATLAAINPFAPGATVAQRSTTAVDARAGFAAGPFAGFAAEIYGGYASTHDALMPVMLRSPQGAFSTFAATNLSGWNIGARLSYAWRSIVEISADGRILPHGNSMARGMAAEIDRARYAVDARLALHPIKALTAAVDFSLRGDRRFYAINPAGSPAEIDAGTLRRLDLSATWRISGRWSVFLRLENLLDSRPLLLPGLPAQGVAGLAGATVRF